MRYSIIVPHCHGVSPSTLQRQDLESALRRLGDCELLTKFSGCPTVEHAVIAGLRKARGEAVVVIEPGDRYPIAQLPALLRALTRADFVCGRRRRRGWPKLAERMARLPRWLFLGLDARDPGCLFWAARREVFNALQLVPRFVRHLPALVARQGFRVDSIYVEERPALRLAGAAPAAGRAPSAPHVAPAGLFSAWWACRRIRRAEQTAATAPAQTSDGQPLAAAAPAATTSEPYRARSA